MKKQNIIWGFALIGGLIGVFVYEVTAYLLFLNEVVFVPSQILSIILIAGGMISGYFQGQRYVKKQKHITRGWKRLGQIGFTLLELLVVIAIIGLLSTVILVAMGDYRARARDARRVSDVQQMQSALGLYRAEAGGFPTTLPFNFGATPNGPIACGSNTYIIELPKDPLNTPSYRYLFGAGSIESAVTFSTPSTSCAYADQSNLWESYTITFVTETTLVGGVAGYHYARPSGIQ